MYLGAGNPAGGSGRGSVVWNTANPRPMQNPGIPNTNTPTRFAMRMEDVVRVISQKPAHPFDGSWSAKPCVLQPMPGVLLIWLLQFTQIYQQLHAFFCEMTYMYLINSNEISFGTLLVQLLHTVPISVCM